MFFVCGFAKCGTTSVLDWLHQHPDVFVPSKKEIHFFCSEHKFSSKSHINKEYTDYMPSSYSDYLDRYFHDVPSNIRTVCEGSTSYGYYESAAKNIYATLGADTKIIFVVRKPLEAIVSRYNHSKSRGWEDEDINKIISDCLNNYRPNLFEDDLIGIYKFKRHISNYTNYFKNILVIDFTKIKENCTSTKIELTDFLGIQNFDLEFPVSNPSYSNPRILGKIYYSVKKPLMRMGVPEKNILSISAKMKAHLLGKAGQPNISDENVIRLTDYYSEDIFYLKERWGIDFDDPK